MRQKACERSTTFSSNYTAETPVKKLLSLLAERNASLLIRKINQKQASTVLHRTVPTDVEPPWLHMDFHIPSAAHRIVSRVSGSVSPTGNSRDPCICSFRTSNPQASATAAHVAALASESAADWAPQSQSPKQPCNFPCHSVRSAQSTGTRTSQIQERDLATLAL